MVGRRSFKVRSHVSGRGVEHQPDRSRVIGERGGVTVSRADRHADQGEARNLRQGDARPIVESHARRIAYPAIPDCFITFCQAGRSICGFT